MDCQKYLDDYKKNWKGCPAENYDPGVIKDVYEDGFKAAFSGCLTFYIVKWNCCDGDVLYFGKGAPHYWENNINQNIHLYDSPKEAISSIGRKAFGNPTYDVHGHRILPVWGQMTAEQKQEALKEFEIIPVTMKIGE